MSSRPKRKSHKSTDMPAKIPRKWKDNEIEMLLNCLMEYGHKDLQKIKEHLPGRSIENIKSYVRSAYDRAGKMTENKEDFDKWIDLCNSSGGTPWEDCMQIAQVLKYLSVDGLLENHPLPTSCQGIDFGLAYRLIYQAIMGYPIQPVNQPTADFVLLTLMELKDEIKKQTDAIKNVQIFLHSKSKTKEPEPTIAEPENLSNKPEENLTIKKPLKVYERKKQSVANTNVTPSLKIVIAEENCNSDVGTSKHFSVTVEGSSYNQSTTVKVPVPCQVQTSNEIPPIIPCYNGKSLKIHEDLVVNGLSAISIKHHKGNCKDDKRSSEDNTFKKKQSKDEVKENKDAECQARRLSDLPYKGFLTSDLPDCLKDKMKRRNSFWNIHRPELSKLTWPENFVSSTVLQDFFHNHLRIHGTFCEPLHEFSNRSSMMDEEFRNYSKLREIVPPRVLPPDEKVVSIMEKSRSVQLNDEDLDPEIMVHKSRAEFCVTIGEYIRRPVVKRTTSQQMPKSYVQPATRYESLPVQHESLLSKEAMFSEERVSAVIGSTEVGLNTTVTKNSSKKSSLGNIPGIFFKNNVDSQLLMVTSPPSLNSCQQQYNDEVTEDSGDPARLRTILSPRDETAADEPLNRHY